jgi:hypothetical protein
MEGVQHYHDKPMLRKSEVYDGTSSYIVSAVLVDSTHDGFDSVGYHFRRDDGTLVAEYATVYAEGVAKASEILVAEHVVAQGRPVGQGKLHTFRLVSVE